MKARELGARRCNKHFYASAQPKACSKFEVKRRSRQAQARQTQKQAGAPNNMSDETALAARQAEFASATTDEARRAAAAGAGAMLERLEGDLFSSADEVRAALTARARPARKNASRRRGRGPGNHPWR